jgi:hypothetical protein
MSDDEQKTRLIEGKIDQQVAGQIPASHAIGGIRPENMMQMFELAKMMSVSGYAVRPFLRNNPGACLAVAMQAAEWDMPVFSVASQVYVVNDQFAYQAQLIAALVLKRAALADYPEYSFEGAGADMACTVACKMKSGRTLSYTSPPIGQIKPQNSPLWKTDPQQQLSYYSIRAWARRHAPHALLGAYDPEELAANFAIDVTPGAPGNSLVERLKSSPASVSGFDAQAIEKTLAPDVTIVESEPQQAGIEHGAPSSPGAVAAAGDTAVPLAEVPAAAPSVTIQTGTPAVILEPTDGAGFVSFVWASVRMLHTVDQVEAFWKKWRRKSAALPNLPPELFKQAGQTVNERIMELQAKHVDP